MRWPLILVLLLVLASVPAAEMLATTAQTRANEAKYAPIIRAAEIAHAIPKGILHRLIFQESRFRSDIIEGRVKSSAGAVGIAQFLPATARELGVDPLNPGQAIDGAARYLSRLHGMFNDWTLAVAAYNAGPGNVRKYGGIPPFAETQAYVKAVVVA